MSSSNLGVSAGARDVAEAPGLRRRQMLTLPLAQLAGRPALLRLTGGAAILPIGTCLTLAPSRAGAEPVTIGLAVASVVAGLIASHNRSDGGMGAILKATLEYQRTISGQLLSMQEGMAELLAKVNALPAEMQKQLYQERAVKLQAKLGEQVIRYHHQATVVASVFRSYQAWAENTNVRNILENIVNQLDQVAAEVTRGRWIDAVTALYLPAAVYASLGGRSALGENSEQLKAEAQRYLDIFQLIENPAEAGSAAADLAIRTANVEQATKELANQRYVVPTEDSAKPTQLRMGRVAVQDFTDRKIIGKRTAICRFRDPRNPDFGEVCHETTKYTDPRTGERETFAFYVKVTPFFLSSTQQKDFPQISIRQLAVEPSVRVEAVPYDLQPDDLAPPRVVLVSSETFGAVTVPPLRLGFPRIITDEAMTTEARRSAASKSPEYSKAEQARVLLSDTASKYNEETARAALCIGALTAASVTRQGLFRFFGLEA